MDRPWSFRPLAVFWGALLVAIAGGAVTLQLMGPIRRTAVPDRPTAPPAPRPSSATALPRAVPAHLQPSIPHPVPDLPMTATSIPDPDPALLEEADGMPGRMLPRIGGGRAPALLYAAAFDPAERHPRVALVIDGAGLDRAMTTQMFDTLPSSIDVAFSAYAPEAASAELSRRARRQGRECLISVPMEPSGFPAAEEGNRALLIGGNPAQNRQNLEWALSAVQGCIGATGGSDGLYGERFAESTQAFAEMLSAIDRRGLIYLDSRPGAAPPADADAARRAPARAVDVIVDRASAPGEPVDAQAIDRNLAELEADAARHGSAIGLAGPPRPVLLDRIAVWAHGLAARGLVLAPLTAIPAGQPNGREVLP